MICGFALACVLFVPIDPATTGEKTWKYIMGGFLGVYYVGGLALFYTAVET